MPKCQPVSEPFSEPFSEPVSEPARTGFPTKTAATLAQPARVCRVGMSVCTGHSSRIPASSHL